MTGHAANMTTAWAPAKVNLYLHVGRPRDDGRHPLDSLVVFSDVRACDRITVRPSQELLLKVDGPGAAALKGEKNNLVLQAARLLREAAERADLGASFNLYKELPTAAGVGGGSADAAAALQILNQYWDMGFSEDALETLGAALGSDVPACLRGSPAVMRGAGEILVSAETPNLPVVLVNAGAKVSTEAVYRRFDKMDLGDEFEERDPPAATANVATYARSLARYRNDLEAPAKTVCPAITETLELIAETPGNLLARMSGSGATCFGVYETEEEAAVAARLLQDRKKKWWVRPARLTGAGEFARASG